MPDMEHEPLSADARRLSEAYMASAAYQNLLARARHARAVLAEKQHSELTNYLKQRSQRAAAPHVPVPWGQKIEYKTTAINPRSFMLGHVRTDPHTLAPPEPSMFETIRRLTPRSDYAQRPQFEEGQLMQMHRKSIETDAAGVPRSILTPNAYYHIFRGGRWVQHNNILV